MSKSRGNVIVPETVADKYGVDVVRMYLMFMGPFDATMVWNEKTLMGVKRFLDKFSKFIKNQSKVETDSSKEVRLIINKLIDTVTRDLKNFKYNTAIAKMMESLNSLVTIQPNRLLVGEIKTLIKLIAPLAPYTAEELWNELGNKNSVHLERWPVADKKYLVDDEVNIPVAINGKVREQLKIASDKLNNKEDILNEAKNLNKIQQWINKNEIVKEIYVPGKMVNLVVKVLQ
jgi:leucyl-tRNA synthetase